MSRLIYWCIATYARPFLLSRLIYAFEHQTYADRRMIIVEDGNQLSSQSGDRWELISVPQRFSSLGSKRNFIVQLAIERGAWAIGCQDDDDIQLPWHTEAAAAALENAEWSRPSVILSNAYHGVVQVEGTFQANFTGHRADQTQERMYHPSWFERAEAFNRVGGYPEYASGTEDKLLMLNLDAAGVTQADPIALGFKPSYIYNWHGSNISGMLPHSGDRTGAAQWAALERKLEPCELQKWEPTWDLANPTVLPGILPRPF